MITSESRDCGRITDNRQLSADVIRSVTHRPDRPSRNVRRTRSARIASDLAMLRQLTKDVLAQYVYPKRKAVEVDGQEEQPTIEFRVSCNAEP